MRPRLVFSADQRFYYITDFKNHPHCWMSVQKIDGAVPEERRRDLIKGWLQVETNDGRLYYRELLPFNFWKVKSHGELEKVDVKSDEFKDYVAYHANQFSWKGY